MSTEHEGSLENGQKGFDLRGMIDSALGQQVTDPQNLRRYALAALNEVVAAIDDAKLYYNSQPTILGANSREQEESAAGYLLGNQNYVDTVIERLLAIDERIAALYGDEPQITVENVIVPPSSVTTTVNEGNGTFEKRQVIDRTVTIKFILERLLGETFDGLKAQGRVEEVSGTVTPGMMRRLSYRLITTTDYNRSLLVCDEEGNRTFVFDTNQLAAQGIRSQDLIQYEKPELDAIIQGRPELGRAIIYNAKTFVPTIISALESLEARGGSEEQNLLVPYATPDVLSGNQIKNYLNEKYGSNIDHKTVYRAADVLRELGVIIGEKYRFGKKRVVPGYTPDEVAAIESKLADMDLLYPLPNDGEISFPHGVAEMLGIGRSAILFAANALGEDLGEMPKRRFVSATSPVCKPEQLEMIDRWLRTQQSHSDEIATAVPSVNQAQKPRGIMTELELTDAMGGIAGYDAIRTILNELGIGRLGIARDDTELLEVIRQKTLEKGFRLPPEGYATRKMIMESRGVTSKRFANAIAALGEGLGKVVKHVHGPRPFPSYSPGQIELIIQKDAELVANRAPERQAGRYTDGEVANALGLSRATADQLLRAQPHIFEFNGWKDVKTYGPDVLATLSNDPVVQKIQSAKPAPEGVGTVASFAREWHVAPRRVAQLARDHHMPIGTYKFGTRTGEGYTERDVQYLHDALEL